MTVSIYKNTTSNESFISSDTDAIGMVIGGQMEEYVNYLRTLGKHDYDAEKKRLPGITWSGTFEQGTRKKETMTSYSNLVCIDIDKIEDAAGVKQMLSVDPHVRYIFISPSGKGIKAIFQVSTGKEHHRAAFLHLEDYIKKTYNIIVDKSGKDECRLCYISHDPQAYININNATFQVDTRYGDVLTEYATVATANNTDSDRMFKTTVLWVERTHQYVEGNRNNYIHALACALNRVGMEQFSTMRYILDNYSGLEMKEVETTVKSAYFHHQHEHNTVALNSIGNSEFVAPAYVMNFSDDIVHQDLMTITSMLWQYKLPIPNIKDIVTKVGKYYDSMQYVDLKRTSLPELMNQAVALLQQNIAKQASANALKVVTAEEVVSNIVNTDMSGALPMYLADHNGTRVFDLELGGGILVGNVYGLIGFGGTMKSIVIQWMQKMDAMNDIPTLMLNGEMSETQYYERLAKMSIGVNFRHMMTSGEINKSNVGDYVEKVKQVTKNNAFVHSGIGFNKQHILSTLDMIYASTGKKVKRLYIDGIGQMDWCGKEEIQANIFNSFVLKEIAKEANQGEGVAIIVLIHCSGEENKVVRNTGTRVRGGSKMLANLDGYFCTSLLIDPETVNEENPDDFGFIPSKFYLRMIDKRSGAQQVSAIVNMDSNLNLLIENEDPQKYEINIKKKNHGH